MDAKTAEALEASIAKWKRNVSAEEPADAVVEGKDCPLCLLFYFSCRSKICVGCPVFRKTGMTYCDGSPYSKALDAWVHWEAGTGSRDAFRAAALAEVAFLESLREPVAVEHAA